ncbi:MAG: hypothetical protein ACOYYU_17595 [Chloroflexota bacterium]
MNRLIALRQHQRAPLPWEKVIAGILLTLGLLLRLRQYLTARSLWLDEAMLALNIVQRDFGGLFQPLDYDQGAPVGFLLVEKILVTLLGSHEFVLRLFPLLAGIASLGLFYLLLRRVASGIGMLTALALFAVGPELVYYASEVKQYSVDVAVTIGLLLLSMPLFEGKTGRKAFVWLGCAGMLALWLSHPALFALAGIGVSLVWMSASRRGRFLFLYMVYIGLAWLGTLGLLYFVSLRNLKDNTFLLGFWQENFMPLPPWSEPGWFSGMFRGLAQNQVGVSLPAFFALALILGWAFLWRRNRPLAVAILGIFVFALLASALRLYPLGGRLSLFMVPLMLALVGEFISVLQDKLHRWPAVGGIVALLAGASLLYSPASESLHNFVHPKYFEHIRPALANLSQNWQPGDALFVSNGAAPAYLFYAERYGLEQIAYHTGEAADYLDPEALARRLDPLRGNPRAWILFSHVYERGDFNEKKFILAALDDMGRKKREFRTPGASVYLYLYDLSR